MGNNIVYHFGDSHSDSDEVPLSLGEGELQDIRNAFVGTLHATPTDMPIIRKKPDLRIFQETMLYKEIKALCGMPANSRRPNEHWSLMRALQKRENGIAASPPGSFTSNQQRRIATLFVPNQKEERLMSGGLDAGVFVCKFNKDGSKLITASQDSLVLIFDSAKGTYHRINRIRARDVDWSILDIDFSPCGKYFAYSTWGNYFFTVPVDGNCDSDCQWIELNSLNNRTAVFSLRFSPCGRSIIGGCTRGCIYIADRETRDIKTIRMQRHFQVDINAVSYLREDDPNVFVSGCNNGIIRLWDLRCNGCSAGSGNSSSSSSSSGGGSSSYNRYRVRSTPVSIFVGHLDGITYIDPRNDGNYFLSNSKDQSIKIWDLRKPTPSNKINKYTKLPLIAWDYRWTNVPREYYNPTTTLDGDVSIMTYRGHRVTKSLLRAKFSPKEQTGQRYIYTGCSTGRIIIYDVLTGQIKEAIEGHRDIVRDLSWHPVRAEIVSSSFDSHVNLNTFKPNPLLKRSNSERMNVNSLRRSRRIAHRNGDLYDEEDDDMYNYGW